MKRSNETEKTCRVWELLFFKQQVARCKQSVHFHPVDTLECLPKEGLATQIFEEPFLHARKRADVDKFIAIAGSTHLEKWHSPTHAWKLNGRQWGTQHNPLVTGAWSSVGNKTLHSQGFTGFGRSKIMFSPKWLLFDSISGWLRQL